MFIEELQANKVSFEEIQDTLKNKPYFFDIKTSKQFPELYLINVQREITNLQDFHDYACGVIMEKNTNKVIARGFNRNLPEEEWDSNYDGIAYAEHAVDGTRVRLYYYDKKWNISTGRCINSRESFIYENNKNYFDLFTETVKDSLDYSKLDINMTYIFVLKHRDNPCVLNYNFSPVVFYIGKAYNRNFTEEYYGENAEKISYDNISYNSIVNTVKVNSFNMDIPDFFNKKGYIVHLKNGKRVELLYEEFKRIEEIRGNNPNIYLRYFELDEIEAEQLCYYFPKYNLRDIPLKIFSKCQILFILYKDIYILKKKKIDSIKEINTKNILQHLINYSHATKTRLTLNSCFERIMTYDEHIICNLMGWMNARPKNQTKPIIKKKILKNNKKIEKIKQQKN